MTAFRRLVARAKTIAFVVVIFCAVSDFWHARVCAAPPAVVTTPRKTAVDRKAARAKPFDPEKLVRAFRGKREDLRLKLLEEIEQLYLSDASLPDALWRVIEPSIKLQDVSDSLLYALRLYGRVDDVSSSLRLISLLEAADLRVVLRGQGELRRRPDRRQPLLGGGAVRAGRRGCQQQ